MLPTWNIEVYGKCKTEYGGSDTWQAKFAWKEIFALLSPYLMEHPSNRRVEIRISEVLFEKVKGSRHGPFIDPQIFETIKIHLKVIGLIDVRYSPTVDGRQALFWFLTKKGITLMEELRAVRKKQS